MQMPNYYKLISFDDGAYAPTSTAEKQDMQNFYEKLNEVISSIPKRETVLMGADFNAKMGKTDQEDHIKKTVGSFG